MALHLNLLHEEQAEHSRRQRDPLKLGMIVLVGLGALLLLFYMLKAYQTLQIKSRLGAVQRDWAKVEPEVTKAQARAAELSATINTTKVLDALIDGRFLWAPLLQTLSRCVAPNAQITRLDGNVSEDSKSVTLSLDGVAAGREPRGAAEELRQLLLEQLTQSYTNVKVEFKSLDDLETSVTMAGASLPLAHYNLGITFNTQTPAEAKAAATPAPRTKK